MKILVTGARGHVGWAVATALAKHDLILMTHTPAEPVKGAVMVNADLADGTALEKIVTDHKPEVIIHLAAMVGGACQNNPKQAERINVDATRILAEAAASYGATDFIFASTAAVYNQTELLATDEDHNVAPQSVYGQTKLDAEQALAKVAGSVRCIALRIFNIYGPAFDQSLVYKLAHSTVEQPVKLFGSHTFYRDYVHVKDVVTALTSFDRLQKRQGFTVLNIASGKATSNAELIAELKNQGITVHFSAEDAAPSYSWANISRARKLLGFEPSQAITVD